MFEVTVDTARGMHVGDHFVSENTCLIGKAPSNKVVLHGRQIEREHARLVMEDDGIFVEEVRGRGGLRVNGKPVRRFGPIKRTDVIEIRDYRIRVRGRSAVMTSNQGIGGGVEVVAASVVSEVNDANAELSERSARTSVQDEGSESERARLSEAARRMHEWRVRIRRGLHEQLDLRRVNVSAMSDEELRELTQRLVWEVLHACADFPDDLDDAALAAQVVAEAVGLGPLEPLLERDDVSEIMVNSSREVFFEVGGRIQKAEVTFTDDQAVQSIIERIVAPTGRRIDESSPMVDTRLRDGSRVNAVIPPLALKGSCITIRKFMRERLTAQHLIEFGSSNDAMVAFLEVAVRNRRNVLISGGTGSGKTTLLNVLSNFIPEDERIVTIEDSAELKLYQPNLVALESRPANQEGRGEVSIRDLVRNSLRMRPDRIVVGECRGGEALDMLQAMNTGHDGSLTTAHANSPRDCFSRLEVMVMMAGMDLPAVAIREQIASAIDLVVQQTRFACGSRKITSVSEVAGIENGRIQLAEVFRFRQTGYHENGRVAGSFEATGLIPEFYEQLHQQGVGLDLGIFRRDGAPA